MELNEIERHWTNWAKEFKLDVRATTKTRTIKELEIAALGRSFKKTHFFGRTNCRVLEVGCGNGHNCFMLSDLFPDFVFTGVDFIPEMISNAIEIRSSQPKYASLNFHTGNILTLDDCGNLDEQYHIVFTDRCLINLNTHELHKNALDQLYRKTIPGGYVVLIENVQDTYSRQNRLRESVGLKPRTPEAFNLFIDEPAFLPYAKTMLTLLSVEDFASLHDLLLYVLVPILNNGNVDYDAAIVKAATTLSLSAPEDLSGAVGSFGQNRLYMFRKECSNA